MQGTDYPDNDSLEAVILYTTAGCHLCEQAEQMLSLLIGDSSLLVEAIDIAEDVLLVEKYGIRIPVVCRPDGEELGWPFDLVQLQQFLKRD